MCFEKVVLTRESINIYDLQEKQTIFKWLDLFRKCQVINEMVIVCWRFFLLPIFTLQHKAVPSLHYKSKLNREATAVYPKLYIIPTLKIV